jgi:hypothetical protein
MLNKEGEVHMTKKRITTTRENIPGPGAAEALTQFRVLSLFYIE